MLFCFNHSNPFIRTARCTQNVVCSHALGISPIITNITAISVGIAGDRSISLPLTMDVITSVFNWYMSKLPRIAHCKLDSLPTPRCCLGNSFTTDTQEYNNTIKSCSKCEDFQFQGTFLIHMWLARANLGGPSWALSKLCMHWQQGLNYNTIWIGQ